MFWQSHLGPLVGGGRRAFPPLALALQGGGAYGAFTWGVLDRLLEEDDVLPAAISGASAGAVNAVVTAWGLLEGGREGARAALRKLWTDVGKMSLFSPLGSPGADLQFDLLTRLVSPYQFNPLNLNPLRDILANTVDFDRLRREGQVSLFISATDVSTGEPRVFRENEMTIDVMMASTCLPHIYQAVEIDGRSYWDGGITGNPPILPMVLETPCRSLLVVRLTPQEEPAPPTAASEIASRLRRILFNASLQRDMVAVEEMRQLLRRSNLLSSDLRRLRDLSVRVITIDQGFFSSNNGSALGARPELLERLHSAGRQAAECLMEGAPSAAAQPA